MASACVGLALWGAAGVVEAQAPAGQAGQGGAAATIAVTGFTVEGNTLLSRQQLDGVLNARVGYLTPAGLRAVAAALQERYREAGYGGVVVFLPEQTLTGGVVKLRVLEGKLARIEISGHKQFDEANVRASLHSLVIGQTPRVRSIDAEIQMANESPAKTVQVLLKPGSAPGEIAAEVAVQEQRVWRMLGRVDNTGGESLGRWRTALGLQHANLWNADHVLTFEWQTAPENTSAVRVASGSYRAPLPGLGLAIDAYGVVSEVDSGVVGTAAGDLQFSGKGGIAGLRLNGYMPRVDNVDARVIFGIEAREYRNNCAIQGLPAGACGSAGASVSLQPVSLTYTAQASSSWRWGLSFGLHGNLAAGGEYGSAADFEAVRPGAPQRYTLLRTNYFATVPVGEWAVLGARAAGQFSGRPLVPGEMFGIGGAQSVRGFEERELSGDSGATLSVEAQTANLVAGWKPAAGGDVRLLAFADAGAVRNSDDTPCQIDRTQCRFGSLGLGVRGQWPAVQVRLDFARAMAGGTSTLKGDTRAHFALLFAL